MGAKKHTFTESNESRSTALDYVREVASLLLMLSFWCLVLIAWRRERRNRMPRAMGRWEISRVGEVRMMQTCGIISLMVYLSSVQVHSWGPSTVWLRERTHLLPIRGSCWKPYPACFVHFFLISIIVVFGSREKRHVVSRNYGLYL